MRSCAEPAVGGVILCAGRGERAGLGYNKVLHFIGQKTAVELCLDAFAAAGVKELTLVCSPADIAAVTELSAPYGAKVCLGGATRGESVLAGLRATPCDTVLIHDGARPFVSPALITKCIASARTHGSGIAAVRSVDTVKRVTDGKVLSLPREQLWNTQTPQAFAYAAILAAYESVQGAYTDDAEVYSLAGHTPVLVEGEYSNVKLTNAADMFRAAPVGAKMGVGFDVHRLVDGRPLVLGGVTIPYVKGLDGHSDADVLIHAIMDALLSAADLPDIGVLFPDTDDRYLGISSEKLLDEVGKRVTATHTIGSVSAVIIAQAPKLAGFIPKIRENLAARLGLRLPLLNVSATTTEHLGIVGRGEAIAASAACLLSERS